MFYIRDLWSLTIAQMMKPEFLTRQLADEVLKMGVLKGPPQLRVWVMLERVQVEPHCAKEQNRVLGKQCTINISFVLTIIGMVTKPSVC